MSVLIKGMETPKSCVNCPIAFFDDEYTILHCPLTAEEFSKNSFIYKRSDNCPLIPVQAHGDLIDRDALRASFRESIDECHKWADEVDKDTMMYARISQSLGTFVECSLRAKAAPTIIPAEEV